MMNRIFTQISLIVAVLFITSPISAQTPDHRTCATMDLYQQQVLQDPGRAQKMEEINRFIENYIRENPSGSRTNVVTTIPVVFHIVHNGDAVGTNENIADTYIYAQLQQLNDDYRRLNADAGNTPAEFSGISADLEIQFCLAQQDPNGLPTTGIMRHDLGVASWTVNNFETTAKPATVWDRDSYLNFWTCVFGGGDAGLLGYAQFPGGDPTTDGVVCLYSSVGSISTPNPAGSPYDIGRTATHEIGHWLDLFHIWGDDGTACTGSDLVSDTPNAAGPYFGCPTYPSSSCSSSDMFMNYMDYTDDACMNAFTQGQKIRVDAVVAGPRASLLSSVGCQAAVPIVSFAIEENNVVEGTSNCNSAGFRNVNVVVSLSIPATGTTSVVITANAGSTADFDDYLLNSSSVTFPSGDNTDKMVSLTIYEDAYIESDESIILDILSVSGSDAVAGTQGQMHTINLQNDDNDPAAGGIVTETIFTEDFEGTIDWTQYISSGTLNDWSAGTAAGLSNSSYYISKNNNQYSYRNVTSLARAQSPIIDASQYTNLQLTFDFKCNGEVSGTDYRDFGSLWFSTDGSTWTSFGSPLQGVSSTTNITVGLPAGAENVATLRVGFQWENNGSTTNNPPFSFDNVMLTGDRAVEVNVQTSTNDASGFAEHNLGPNTTVHFYDQVTGNIMMSIENLTAHDFGCTRVEVDRAGAGETPWISGYHVTQKTFRVIPEFNNASAAYQITLFYEGTEVPGAWPNYSMVKSADPISSADPATSEVADATIESIFGTADLTYTAIFSGFSGFAISDAPPLAPLPVELLSFNATPGKAEIYLNWSTATEINSRGFELQRSIFPAQGFEKLAWINGAETSFTTSDYQAIDAEVKPGVQYYYRLKQMDNDGHFQLSGIVSGKVFGIGISASLFPNPVAEYLQVRMVSDQLWEGELVVVDLLGREVYRQKIAVEGNAETSIDVSGFASGIYLQYFSNEGQRTGLQRFVVK